ncbi:MAG: hypothetical protein N4A63_13100 [Vallitalea sp.]|nr:hypothetical protein [Vallitalea sp.]
MKRLNSILGISGCTLIIISVLEAIGMMSGTRAGNLRVLGSLLIFLRTITYVDSSKNEQIEVKGFVIKSIVVILVLGAILHLLGYRISGLEAAKAHFAVGKNPEYIDEIDYNWGRVYLFHTDQGPRTVISKRYGIL